MYRCIVFWVFSGIFLFQLSNALAVDSSPSNTSVVLATMADGIGDLTFASPEWVDVAEEALKSAASKHADALSTLGTFTLCEVAHNPPGYLHVDRPLAWNVTFNGAEVTIRVGELPAEQCDYKVEGDHSIISNLARIQYHGNDPDMVAAAQARLRKLSRWEKTGSLPEHKALRAVLRSFHDTMAVRTMPRLLWMTPEWVEIAREIVSTRARMEEFSEALQDVEYRFSEMFLDGPRYAFPDGREGGFWVMCSYGEVTVGFGPLPEKYGPADYYNEGLYTPILPLGRTVNPALTEADKKEMGVYIAAALPNRPAPDKREFPRINKPFPKGLSAVMSVLHDELSKRTSGELPSDYDGSVKPTWAKSQAFDRPPSYDASWVLYDKFDIYGEPLKR